MVKGQGKPPFVKSVNHEREVAKDSSFKITLNAEWPTPSWSHENTDINIDNANSTVIINYLGTRRPGVAMQAIKSFTAGFDVKLSQKGEWTLIVKGRSEDWESSIKVI